jgi:predicted glycogen debranching enzyme
VNHTPGMRADTLGTAALRRGRADFTQADGALETEWLVTNGLGGFACGTVAQANTRRYHGLLIATLPPPLQRVLMLSKIDPSVRYGGAEWALGCNEFADGTLTPRGFEHLSAFSIELGIPTWIYAFADALLQQRVWMDRGRNTTFLCYTLLAATQAAELELLPLCTYRDYHSHSNGGWQLEVTAERRSLAINAFPGARTYSLTIDRGEAITGGDWYRGFRHRAEALRGLDANEDLYRPGVFHTRLTAGQSVSLIASAEPTAAAPSRAAFRRETARRRALLRSARAVAAGATPKWMRQLTLAADHFIVAAPHLSEMCLGTISEIFDGDAPHRPRGCIAQAWSVAETLRAWHTITAAQASHPAHRATVIGEST